MKGSPFRQKGSGLARLVADGCTVHGQRAQTSGACETLRGRAHMHASEQCMEDTDSRARRALLLAFSAVELRHVCERRVGGGIKGKRAI
jgi:hypothetical protein